jgi:hypothetical protein
MTLSPRWNVDKAERAVRARLARGEGVVLGVSLADTWQVRQLRRLFHRLREDESLMVSDGQIAGKGTRVLVVAASGAPSVGWFGEFKVLP